MTISRVLPLSGVHNFRDYGGYATSGGGRLKKGVLWRSAQHEQATDEDLEEIDALDLGAVVDLRGDDERALHPCRRSPNFGATVYFADGTTAGLAPHLQAAKEAIDATSAREKMIDIYRDMPFRGPLIGTMRLYFQALAQSDAPSLIHCVAGKDRTGFSVWLLHHLLGVHEDDAMQDYLLTNEAGNIEARIAQGAQHLRSRISSDISDDAVRAFMSVDADYLHAAIQTLKAEFGSPAQFAEEILGVDAAQRERLAVNLVV